MILQKKSLSKEKGDLNDAFPEDTGNAYGRREKIMLEFAPNTYMLTYQDGAYLCNARNYRWFLWMDALFARQVSWAPRSGWRPVHLCWERGGTYAGHHLVAGERVTKSKFWLYAEQGIFYYRYLMRLIDGKWMIDNAQCCREGHWSFCGL